MKYIIQLTSVALLLAAVLVTAFHPDFGVLWTNPLALIGVGLIGFGLFRNAQLSVGSRTRATQPVNARNTSR